MVGVLPVIGMVADRLVELLVLEFEYVAKAPATNPSRRLYYQKLHLIGAIVYNNGDCSLASFYKIGSDRTSPEATDNPTGPMNYLLTVLKILY